MTTQPRMIISAPFGNYVQPVGVTPTLGTFTAAARGGRLWRILRTLRYYWRLRAWVNKIGLRNPGMPWLVEGVRCGRIDPSDKLVSVHGFSAEDWYALLAAGRDLAPLGLELNMSCPNVGEVAWPDDLFARAFDTAVPIIVKLPPVNYETMLAQALAAGLRVFHCCNTLPVPSGGISGAPLKPVALQCIRRVLELAACDDLRIIGGGGIRSPADIDDYAAAGAHAIAVGTKVLNPLYLFSHHGLQPLRDRAAPLPGWNT